MEDTPAAPSSEFRIATLQTIGQYDSVCRENINTQEINDRSNSHLHAKRSDGCHTIPDRPGTQMRLLRRLYPTGPELSDVRRLSDQQKAGMSYLVRLEQPHSFGDETGCNQI